MTNLKYECKNMIFSLTSWDKYPEDVQALLKEAAKKFGDEHRQAIVNSQDQQLKELEEAGMEVTYPDVAELQEATASVYDDFYAENDWAEDLVKRIREKMAE
jgi:TRAP-type C4-dicarboxylate transport system substrate-binding protein